MFFTKLLALASILYIPLICSQILDIKIIIALSSVAHIGIGLLVFLFFFDFAERVFVYALLVHGFRSSLIFFFSYFFYLRANSRSLVFRKRLKLLSV